MRMRVTPFVVLLTINVVHCYVDLNKIVKECIAKTNEFLKTEDMYSNKEPVDFNFPNLAGPQIQELQEKVYVKEIAQRPFECITDKVPKYLYQNLLLSSEYQKLVSKCQRTSPLPRCDHQSMYYRTIDGTCNNWANRAWGSVLNRQKRLLPANYIGAAGIQNSMCRKPLDPRTLSKQIHQDKSYPNLIITEMFLFFGQVIAHDISDVPTSFIRDKPFDCCSKSKGPLHPQCMPIKIPEDDYFYSKHNVTCISFGRAAMANTCNVGPRYPMNEATSYIDLSLVYGLSDTLAKNLRTNDGTGKLIMQKYNGDVLLPGIPDANFCDKDSKYNCFFAGDKRVDMHSLIMSFHTLLLREHNRLAEELHKINPLWSEEKLYQEARKINIAQMQVITYKEFLPLLIGPKLMEQYGLAMNGNKNSVYNPFIDASLFAEFNTAAYRLHSLINRDVVENVLKSGTSCFKDISINVEPLYEGEIASLMHGVCQQSSQKYDRYLTEDVTNYLYKPPKYDWGFDLAAVNIQRGRDMGLPTYTEIVRYLTGGKIDIQVFNDLKNLMTEDSIKILKKIYCDVRDIDTWVGMNNERVHQNMVVGPTATKIIGLQFKQLKDGDRFYFEHPGVFSYGQLQTLRNVSLSSLMCQNTDMKSIQVNPFLFPNPITNPTVLCKDFRKLDISQWLDVIHFV